MSVITVGKSCDELQAALSARGDLPAIVLGCDKCAKVSKTGGSQEVRELRDRLRSSGVAIREPAGLVDAVEEGLCDPKAVAEKLVPLTTSPQRDYQILVLSCGAGLKCVRDILPGVRLVPGLDTLGPGVKGELACLACGHCEFGEAGCKMLRVAGEQARRLSLGYPAR
ncbi:MAG: hypothetical protein HXY20_05270 [Acidobacteria bacterium]|nr:hypothetical protein [Acidobacteriota bacterium]